MYGDYNPLEVCKQCRDQSASVLDKLPQINGPQLVTSLIRPLVAYVNSKSGTNETFSCLEDDKDVHWIMEVIGYGLSLPLADKEQIDAVRDCVNIYYEWFHALLPSQASAKCIPRPIQQDPNLYCRKILGHLYSIFIPRTYGTGDNVVDLISRQVVLCHRILRLVVMIASDPENVLTADSWECLLVFLLGINEQLLKLPGDSEDIGTQLAERVISTLFEVWLLACVACFPSPPYWKTFQHVCINLRHRPELIIQWNRVNICLTSALVRQLYHTENNLPLTNEIKFAQYQSILQLMDEQTLRQCWFRFLHVIGNPIELCFPELVFKSIAHNHQIDQNVLYLLPFLFHKAIKGLCTLVDIFLGIPNIKLDELDYEIPKLHSMYNEQQTSSPSNSSNTPPEKRRSNFSLLNKTDKQQQQQPSSQNNPRSNRNSRPSIENTNYTRPSFTPVPLPSSLFHQNRVKSSSILDIFGKWLFQASLTCSPNSAILSVFNEILFDREIINSVRSTSFVNQSDKTWSQLTLDQFEAGQAEALGALCRIFCFKKIDEDISLIVSKQAHPDCQKMKHYLTSYYLALKFGLSLQNESLKMQLLSSILVNSTYLFEVDLPGSKILIPHYLKTIEVFLVKRDKSNSPIDVIIRRSCIKILASLLSYPLHYRELAIKDTLTEMPSNTFISLFPRLILLLVHGLYNESDSINIQSIMTALLFVLEDCVKKEYLLVEPLTDCSTGELLYHLLAYFKSDSNESGFDEAEKSDIPRNLFLLIVSFVAEMLCKSSLKSNNDYNVSLSALEVLCALARLHYKNQYLCNGQCKLCIKQICSFIESQCYKQAMFHSKDMHSTIVAAYNCLSIWIHEHSHLTQDPECIVLLAELIELGISGTKSKRDTYKSEKELKPTSLRVKEAAELLRLVWMAKSSALVPPMASSSILSCELNEGKVFEQLLGTKLSQPHTGYFRHLVTENPSLVSILVDTSSLREESILFMRTQYDKCCLLVKYQHHSIRQILHSQHNIGYYNRQPKVNNHLKQTTFSYFPAFFDKLSSNKYDNLVPRLIGYIQRTPDIKQDFDIMRNLLDKIENNLKFEKTKLTLSATKKELTEPVASKTFDACRLILSQFKFFNFATNKIMNESNSLNLIDSTLTGYQEQLDRLDNISSKCNDLVAIYYIGKEFTNEMEIVQCSAQQYRANNAFREFMLSLGELIGCHGNSSNSSIFYWSDISHELLFVIPTAASKPEDQLTLSDWISEDNESVRNRLLAGCASTKEHANDRIKSYLLNNSGCDLKLVLLWVESLDDLDRLPLDHFCSSVINGEEIKEKLNVIIIHPVKNGLFQVLPHSFGNKSVSGSAASIVDRMLLSKHLLGPYVRLYALNLFRRRRMNTESFQLPHIRRRLKIQEINNKYKVPYSNKQLSSKLFASKCVL